MATRQEVVAFLALCATLVKAGDALIVPREKNKQGLIDLGMTNRSAMALIVALPPECYCKGPEADRDRTNQQVWVFGDDFSGVEGYIKLTVETLAGGRQRLNVLGFHPSEHPLTYPFASTTPPTLHPPGA